MGHISMALVLHLRHPTTTNQSSPSAPHSMGPHCHHPSTVTDGPLDPAIDIHSTLLHPTAQRNPLSLPNHPTTHCICSPDRQLRDDPHAPIHDLQTGDLHPPDHHPDQHIHFTRAAPPTIGTDIPRRRCPLLSAHAEPDVPTPAADPGAPDQPRTPDRGDAFPRHPIVNAARPPTVRPPRIRRRAQANHRAEDAREVDLR